MYCFSQWMTSYGEILKATMESDPGGMQQPWCPAVLKLKQDVFGLQET